jgi:hypothetical protein
VNASNKIQLGNSSVTSVSTNGVLSASGLVLKTATLGPNNADNYNVSGVGILFLVPTDNYILINGFSGKTLLLNGEDYDTLALMEERSIANYRHLLEGVDLLAIDEAQNIPEIGSKLKLIVDEIEGEFNHLLYRLQQT